MTPRELAKIITFYGRFMPSYTMTGYWGRRLTWGANRAPDYSGQSWLVTGASTGLGAAMLKAAAEGGANVIGVSRSVERLELAARTVKPEARERIRLIAADLSLRSGTQELIDRLAHEGVQLDVLQNNAGLLLNELEVTGEGLEASFATNVLTHYQLTEALIANGVLKDDAVVVNMTSGGMYNAPLGIRKLNVTDPAKYHGKVAYAYAKRAQVALTRYWNHKYGSRGLRFYVTHPGWAKTPGVKQSLPVFWKIQNLLLRTPRQGADTALWLAATQPPIAGEDVVWFDRKPRETHMYDFTKKAQCTEQELVDYLQNTLGGASAAVA